MDCVTVGSVGLNRVLGYEYRRPTDVDHIMRPEVYEEHVREIKSSIVEHYPVSGKNIVIKSNTGLIQEIELAYTDSSAELILEYAEEYGVTLNLLYTIKMSHRYLRNSPHFLKTMRDIQFLRKQEATMDKDLLEILELREQETYTYEHPKLNTGKDDFFADDGIDYVFDHDSIHQAVAVGDQPAYTRWSTGEVMCDMNKFVDDFHLERVRGVYEESCVLALERAVVPHGADQHKAFLKALEKVCTSITSGRFREFAWNNYDDVIDYKNSRPVPYHEAFYKGIVNGTVKPHGSK